MRPGARRSPRTASHGRSRRAPRLKKPLRPACTDRRSGARVRKCPEDQRGPKLFSGLERPRIPRERNYGLLVSSQCRRRGRGHRFLRDRPKDRNQPLEPPSASLADPSVDVVPLSCSHLPPVPPFARTGLPRPHPLSHRSSLRSTPGRRAARARPVAGIPTDRELALPQGMPPPMPHPAVNIPPARTICRNRSSQLSAIVLPITLASSGPPRFVGGVGRRW